MILQEELFYKFQAVKLKVSVGRRVNIHQLNEFERGRNKKLQKAGISFWETTIA